jgi:hypothetical protein
MPSTAPSPKFDFDSVNFYIQKVPLGYLVGLDFVPFCSFGSIRCMAASAIRS